MSDLTPNEVRLVSPDGSEEFKIKVDTDVARETDFDLKSEALRGVSGIVLEDVDLRLREWTVPGVIVNMNSDDYPGTGYDNDQKGYRKELDQKVIEWNQSAVTGQGFPQLKIYDESFNIVFRNFEWRLDSDGAEHFYDFELIVTEVDSQISI